MLTVNLIGAVVVLLLLYLGSKKKTVQEVQKEQTDKLFKSINFYINMRDFYCNVHNENFNELNAFYKRKVKYIFMKKQFEQLVLLPEEKLKSLETSVDDIINSCFDQNKLDTSIIKKIHLNKFRLNQL